LTQFCGKKNDKLPISSLYCKKRKTVFNQYIIGEDQVLWGYGTNVFDNTEEKLITVIESQN
jgi:pectin methylesterase-like acyl-CoA thioesterase